MKRINPSPRRLVPVLLLLLMMTIVLLAALLPLGRTEVAAQQPDTLYVSPIHGGCYLVTPSTCKIKVDPFTIITNANLFNFKLQANGQTIYDFSTDSSNPPLGDYTPSQVKQDFAARCGATYTLNLIANDSSSPAFYNLGSTRLIQCPEGVFKVYMPTIQR